MTTRHRRALLAPAALLLLLTACAPTADDPGTGSDGATPRTSPTSEASTTPSEEPGSDPAAPAATAPVGCELVSRELVTQYLHLDPGACEPITSWADGPAGLYPAITMAVDTTASAPMYMPVEVCGGGGIDGALPVSGADYGYAVDGELCIVKGAIGVKTSALLDDAATTAADWQALAVALLPRL